MFHTFKYKHPQFETALSIFNLHKQDTSFLQCPECSKFNGVNFEFFPPLDSMILGKASDLACELEERNDHPRRAFHESMEVRILSSYFFFQMSKSHVATLLGAM